MDNIKTALLVMTGGNAPLYSMTKEATEIVFPSATLACISCVDEARQKPSSGPELLLLANPKPQEVTLALETRDASGLARWPIVVFSSVLPPIEGVEILMPEESSLPCVAQSLREAVKFHRLKQENARLRGDLLTVGNRFCHDLRVPLGGVASATELLKEVLAEETPSLASLTDPIFHSSDEMVRMIKRLSFLIKASLKPAPPTSLSMKGVVIGAIERLETYILKRNAFIQQPVDWPQIEGVDSWLETIWWNLVANALQFGGDPPRVDLGWDRLDGEYRFWVRDNGTGIAEEIKPGLFQPFHQLHESTGRKGFGLSIVQRLVKLQNGDCGYTPIESGGSCFFFTLPAKS